jgi:uncharacterized protein (DUF58 family)
VKRYLGEVFASWARRRQGADTFPVSVHYRRIYILPTRAGWSFALLLFGMFIAALNYSNSTALFFTFWLGGFALVVMHRCHRNLLGVRLTSAIAAATFAGRHGALELTLENTAALIRYGIEADLTGAAAAGCDLEARGASRLTLAVPTQARGVLAIDRLRLTTALPFGLVRAWTWVYLPLEMIVYPRARGVRPLPTAGGATPGTVVRGGGDEDEWLGLRGFRDGDSPRQVAWKAYARGAPLLVKEYESSGAAERRFDFEQLAGLDTEKRLEQLTRWVVDAEYRGERYALALPGFNIAADHGPQHEKRCLRALALYGLAPTRKGAAQRA